jgi:SAM-dependent methyltransferase
MEELNYFINNPIFLKYKRHFDFAKLRYQKYLKTIFINERIVEIPFAIACLNNLPKGQKILDLGCTESTFPLQAATLGYNVTGFDFRKYPYAHPNLQFVQGDILKLPFSDEEFDAVFCISTIEHIGLGSYADPKDQGQADQKAVKEAARVLKKNGTLVLTVPYGILIPNDHHRVYNQNSLSGLLNGFKIQEQRYFINERKVHGARNNFWQEVKESGAAKISSDGSANGVCLVKALK